MRFNTNGYTLTITNSPAIQVSGTGKLYLTGKVTSTAGVGVEVLSGGYLSITGSDTHTTGTTTHTWACPYCGAGETEACTFTFDQDGNGTCGLCGNTIAIAVDESDLTNLVYDGTIKPEDVEITVTFRGAIPIRER